ncbi:unnamed protein product [Dibothriocephalus latus]|uniref:mRNA (guanine-N(7))-methyltransferase n=1 Tax=Dibothriocephalus latus TaxID=60516 RepID=A0A3P7P3M7_DIBLA|nr:unnamed protein product [Dibothriocephalus latus]
MNTEGKESIVKPAYSHTSSNNENVRAFYDANAVSSSNVSLETRSRSRIYFLRNLNNWVKSTVIIEFLEKIRRNRKDGNVRVLDFCCGKGGDQMKWLKGGVSHVTFVDISSASIDVCKDRYYTLKARNKHRPIFSAEFIVHDCATPIDFAGKFDLISCQFALHYAFESYSQVSLNSYEGPTVFSLVFVIMPAARSMLQNVSSALNENGFFIATLPNAYELVRRYNQVKTSAEDPVTFGNSVYSIKFKDHGSTHDPNKLPLFGAGYTFQLEGVVDCPEYLVHPSLLKAMAAEVNLSHLVGPLPFPKHLKDETQRNQASVRLLSVMDALETWTAPSNVELCHSDHRIRTNDGYRKDIGHTHRSPSRDRSPIGRRPRDATSDRSDELSPNCGSVEHSTRDSHPSSNYQSCRRGYSPDNRQSFNDHHSKHSHYSQDRNRDGEPQRQADLRDPIRSSRDRSPIGWRSRDAPSDRCQDLSPNRDSMGYSFHGSHTSADRQNCPRGYSPDNRQSSNDNHRKSSHSSQDRNRDGEPQWQADRRDSAWRPNGRPNARDDNRQFNTYNSPASSNHLPLAGSSEIGAYRHVEEAVKKRPAITNQLIGTISYPEWEVFSLYCIFAFQKTKA